MKLKRHKNLQDKINDPYSCRLCLEEEEFSFHVIAECPATQFLRTKIFDLPTPSTLLNPPDWRVSQVARFLKESSIGNMLEQNWYKSVVFFENQYRSVILMELGMSDTQNKVIMFTNSMIIMINNQPFSLLHTTTHQHQGREEVH